MLAEITMKLHLILMLRGGALHKCGKKTNNVNATFIWIVNRINLIQS
ncbi:hypothetical protein AAZX31_07G182600 [Glycine max]